MVCKGWRRRGRRRCRRRHVHCVCITCAFEIAQVLLLFKMEHEGQVYELAFVRWLDHSLQHGRGVEHGYDDDEEV